VDLIGFACDAGVARNKGRLGAAQGPAALRSALGSLALHTDVRLTDHGDIAVHDDAGLEPAQDELAQTVAASIASGAVPCVLGGGHETAWGTFRGVNAGIQGGDEGASGVVVGILNLDQHFDLRKEDRATSGTPFRQMAEHLRELGEPFRYTVIGISEPNNTAVGFETARELGVDVLLDEDCTVENALAAARRLVESVDRVYMTLDLDVLPAAVAPGVSAPAAFGVEFAVVRAVMREVARSGKLAGFDVVELNPVYDVDARTARTAARLINDVVHALR
jgi:formiminoglutamase